MIDKVVGDPRDAVRDIEDGAVLAVGGFGLSGVPIVLIDAISESTTATDLQIASNNCGTDGWGLGVLLEQHRIARVVASYIGENREFGRQYLGGEVEVELTPQGTLAERLRAAGTGIPAFFTATGAGTMVGDGGLPWRYAADGSVAVASPAKQTQDFDGQTYILERSLPADFGLVRAARGDRHGNLVFHSAARNFNPLAAMAGRITIAEVEQLVEPGDINPDEVHLPGVFVQRVVPLTAEQVERKHIEKRTTRENGGRPT